MLNHVKRKMRHLSEKSDTFGSFYSRLSLWNGKRFSSWSDRDYIIHRYHEKMGVYPNIEQPQTFNEKLQWIKLYNRNPLYTQLVDKYKVREYVAARIGEEYLNRLYGVYDRYEDIDIDELPEQFVLKCNHDCGSICVCTEKKKFDSNKARKTLNSALKRNYFFASREWPYKNVKPKIIAEQYLVDESGDELKDYKFFCFNGIVKLLFIATDRNKKTTTYFDFFDNDFIHLSITNGHPNSPKEIMKPQSFDRMIELAEKLSAGIPFVRVDFYDVWGKIYFGEMTFFHWGGMMPFDPPEWDYTLGSWLDISTLTNSVGKEFAE